MTPPVRRYTYGNFGHHLAIFIAVLSLAGAALLLYDIFLVISR